MSKNKDFGSLADTLGILTEGKISDHPEKDKQKEKPLKILLRIDPEDHAALQKEARTIAAKEDRNYSLTELINDILKEHLKVNKFGF